MHLYEKEKSVHAVRNRNQVDKQGAEDVAARSTAEIIFILETHRAHVFAGSVSITRNRNRSRPNISAGMLIGWRSGNL